MKYIGLQRQVWQNNTKSTLLLLAFPALILALVWLFFFIIYRNEPYYIDYVNQGFFRSFPWVAAIVLLWFFIAYFSHSGMIKKATSAATLERKSHKRVYNLVENLCISQGMTMPKINIIEDDSLNAFASGINKKTYTVTLSRGIINKLNDKELEGVIAHELTHIQNRDVRLLIVSIIFVGIFAFISEMAFRMLLYGRHRRSNKKGGGQIMLIILVLAIVGYLLSMIFRFALSRKREYLADAGAAQITKNPLALASSLEKISRDARIEAVKRRDVAQLFIENPQEKKSSGFFSGHPRF